MKLPWSLLPAQLLCYIYAAWSCINFSLFFKCFWNFLNTIARSALGNLLLFSSKLCWSLQNHYSTLLFVQPTWHRVCNESLKKYSSSSVCVYVCACACVCVLPEKTGCPHTASRGFQSVVYSDNTFHTPEALLSENTNTCPSEKREGYLVSQFLFNSIFSFKSLPPFYEFIWILKEPSRIWIETTNLLCKNRVNIFVISHVIWIKTTVQQYKVLDFKTWRKRFQLKN